jgi:hypothetical protein
MRSDATQTPTILPDISPTKEDLNDAKSASNENDHFASTSTSTDSGGNDVDNTDDEETNDREEDDGDDSGDGPSMIPFP